MAQGIRYADVHVESPGYPLTEIPELPTNLSGAVLFGLDAKQRCEECFRWNPDLWWQHGEVLDRVVGENNAHFPSRATQVVDLKLDPNVLRDWLKRPHEWWPLCETLRGPARLLRLHLPPGASSVAPIKQVVKNFPDTYFWIDPFVHGPQDGWEGHVRLATYPNVLITTLGLVPSETSQWSEEEAQKALRYTVGEVGAGVLMYASGLSWDDFVSHEDLVYLDWFIQTPELDGDEQALVLCENAERIFGSFGDMSDLGMI